MRRLFTPWQVSVLAIMGMYSLTLSPEDNFNNTYNDVEAFPKTDASEMMIVMCPDQMVPVDPGLCSADVTVNPPDTDNPQCPISFFVDDLTGTGDPSGVFPVGEHLIEWTVDDCNGTTTCVQKIVVVDNEPPVMTKADTAYAQCSEDEIPTYADFYEYLAANGDATDNCGLDTMSFMVVDTTTDGGSNPETVIRRYRIADQQLPPNYDTVEHVIIVEDTTEPDPSCKDDLVLGLSDSPKVMSAEWLVDGPTDNCGTISSIQAVRMGDPPICGYTPNPVPSDSVSFCCEDVGNTVMVQVIVTDDNGNANTCMVLVTVADNVAPQPMSSLDDITVSCSYDIDTTDLSAFGVVETDMAEVDPVVIDDPGFQSESDSPSDAMVLENCPDNLSIVESIDDQRDDCYRGDIIRTITVTDGSGNNTVFVQIITTEDITPFGYKDIVWPADVTINDCTNLMPDPDSTGRPAYLDHDKCNQPTATYQDLLFDHPNSGCPKIRREWSVIDWCNYDKLTGEGKWSFYQYIKVINEVAPVFTAAPDTLEACTPLNDCGGEIAFSTSAVDDCTPTEDLFFIYELDEGNNGDIDFTGKANAFSYYLDLGEHSITWTVEDKCGNLSTKTQIVNVKECKAPTPICYRGLAISLDDEGNTEVWATDFNNKSNDNCTPQEDLVFSFSADTSDKVRYYDCNQIGQQTVEMWVTDAEGNQAYCETWVDVQDNFGGCPDQVGGEEEEEETVAMIAGRVITEYETALPDAQINVSGPEMETYQMTDNAGKYAFESLDIHNTYEVIPTKDDTPLQGVSTLDLVIIQQHILGINELNSPYKLIAADINNNKKVSASDLIQLRKMILGVYEAFPENNSWRFVESRYGIIEDEYPWPFVEGMYIEDLTQDMMDNDFIGIKIGDVNGSVEEKLTRDRIETRSDQSMELYTVDRYVQEGEVVELTLSADDFRDLIAMQWTITVDNESLNFLNWKGGDLKLSNDNLAVIDGEGQHITFAWTDLDPTSLSAGSEVITLEFQVRRDGKLSELVQFGSTITPALAYNHNQEQTSLNMVWVDNEGNDIVLYQNSPNPFLDRTTIHFDLPQDMNVSMVLTDISGKVIYDQKDFFKKGKNTILVTSSDLNGINGVVYYTLKTQTKSITKKMILLR